MGNRKLTAVLAAVLCFVVASCFGVASSYRQGNVIVLKGHGATYSLQGFNDGSDKYIKSVKIQGYGGAVNYDLHSGSVISAKPFFSDYLTGASAGTTTTLLRSFAGTGEGIKLPANAIYMSTSTDDTGSSSAVWITVGESTK